MSTEVNLALVYLSKTQTCSLLFVRNDSTDSHRERNRGRKKKSVELQRVHEVSLNSSGHDKHGFSLVCLKTTFFLHPDSASRLTESRSLVERQIMIHCAIHCRSATATGECNLVFVQSSAPEVSETFEIKRIGLNYHFVSQSSGRLSCVIFREDVKLHF